MVRLVASAFRRKVVAIAAFALLASGCGDFAIGIAYDKPSVLALPDRSNAHLSLAADGDHVAAAWAASNSTGTDIYAAFSRDGGAHFSAPVRVNDVPGDAIAGGEQPPRIVIKDQRVNVVWVSKHDGAAAIRAAASNDGGATFSRATTITPSGLTGARGWESAALSDDGALHAVWLDGRNAAPAPPHEHHAPHAPGAPSAPYAPMRQDIYHAIWRGTDPPVETQVAANVCFCCKTAIVTHGRDVYVAWRHLFGGSIRDIAVARSADGGATFSAPVRVSADNWKIDACPDDGPAMAVDASGVLHIVWPTMVHDTAGDRIAIFEAESADAGATFTPRRRVDTATASAAHPRIAIGPAGPAVVWDELAEGERRAWMRAGDGQAVALSTGAGNYPAVAATGRSFVAGWTEQDGERAIVRTRVSRAAR
jgi:hypothetical protein